MVQDELEDELDMLEPLSTRILNWLLKAGWLRKVDDYHNMTVNIVIPDYAAAFVDAFTHLAGEDEDATQVYIRIFTRFCSHLRMIRAATFLC